MNKQEEALQSELSLAMAVAALLRTVAGLLDGVCSGTDGTGRPNAIHHRPPSAGQCSPVGLLPNWAHPTFFLAFQAY